jgi:protein-S-isoprenylcysteine O-methyltransferase Ste14
MLFYLSLALSTLSLISLAVLGGIFAFYDRIASYEERRLAEAFGPAYQAYRAKVPKWLPRFGAAR